MKFAGPSNNQFGIGAQVDLYIGSEVLTWQNYNTRGFQSSIEPSLIFGLGYRQSVDRLEVIWPDKKSQTLKNVGYDQVIELKYSEARGIAESPRLTSVETPFKEVSRQMIAGRSKHIENRYNDFDHEILLHRMLSTDGPRVLSADVNGDELEDFLLMGAHDDEDKLFLQTSDGSFRRKVQNVFEITRVFESTCGTFYDHDGDGDLDLMLGGGGNEYMMGTEFFVLRYYENDGKGVFSIDQNQVPQVVGNFGAITSTDIDRDGDQDLFLGGRIIPGNYGLPQILHFLRMRTGTG
ncbi:MAG: ASPIC/UnbV domain-containing protein [Saprospiraceae bacterium]|nr:ASPIC/UnbV domain-containing protein [Saprospiraceae bacterium]